MPDAPPVTIAAAPANGRRRLAIGSSSPRRPAGAYAAAASGPAARRRLRAGVGERRGGAGRRSSSRRTCRAGTGAGRRPGRDRICESSERMPENSTAMTERAVRRSMPKSLRGEVGEVADGAPVAAALVLARAPSVGAGLPQRREERGVLLDGVEGGADEGPQLGLEARRGAASTWTRICRSSRSCLPPVEGHEEVVLVGEVLVDERPGHPGPRRRPMPIVMRVGTDLGDQRLRHVEQRVAPVVGRQALGPHRSARGRRRRARHARR